MHHKHLLTTFAPQYFVTLSHQLTFYYKFSSSGCTEMPSTSPVENFNQLINETLGPGLKVENIQWKPLTGPGENYGSTIYSLDAIITKNGKTETLPLVVKLPPPSKDLLTMFNSPVTFWKELVFYRDVAPKLIQLQLDNFIEQNEVIDLTAKYCCGRLGLIDPNVFDDQATIVMENLIASGYTMRDRLLGLDFEHTKFAIGGLARLHAMVIGLKLKTPEFFKNIVIPMLVDPLNEAALDYGREMIREIHISYKEIPEAQPYLDRLDRALKVEYEITQIIPEPLEPWGTMTHNDFWSNNIMFKYSEQNRPIGMKIVDFQFCYYDSGTMDLIFFLISSANETVLDNHLDEMIDYYYESFINCLKTLNVDTKIFTRKDFDTEVSRSAPIRLGHCLMMINVINTARVDSKEPKEIDKHPSVKDDPRIVRKLLHILKIYDKQGWLVQ
ncbi:uncharacterized protein LOC105690573 [Athalia rosae]|uniref:uncharacterized protein LOC105690573 n=1 Tax=Athalia rosae TaxID=37344 RepID=UPI0020333D40|nr:uncharacterized protein LOC105690573 [Athalia rosae]